MLLGNCADCREQSLLFLSLKKMNSDVLSVTVRDMTTHTHSLTGKEHLKVKLVVKLQGKASLRGWKEIMSFYIVPSKEINNKATKEYFIYTWRLPGSYY